MGTSQAKSNGAMISRNNSTLGMAELSQILEPAKRRGIGSSPDVRLIAVGHVYSLHFLKKRHFDLKIEGKRGFRVCLQFDIETTYTAVERTGFSATRPKGPMRPKIAGKAKAASRLFPFI